MSKKEEKKEKKDEKEKKEKSTPALVQERRSTPALVQERKEEKKEYTSIKVPKETREKLVDMGVGISQAVQTLVEAREKAIVEKVKDVTEIGEEIGEILLNSGFFNIKFEGGGITEMREDGEAIEIVGFLRITVPDKEVRDAILGIMEGKPNEP